LVLFLENNEIKIISGETFQGLDELTIVWLRGNPCIDNNFETSTEIAALREIAIDECENQNNVKTILASLFSDESDEKVLSRYLIKPFETHKPLPSEEKLKELELKLEKSEDKITRLEDELDTSQTALAKLEEYQEGLNLQSKKIFDQMDSYLRLQLQKIDEMNISLRLKDKEIIEKNKEIEELKEKLEVLERNGFII
jgi:predicted RNase H-like nuclease (RuvC/YqgF family)